MKFLSVLGVGVLSLVLVGCVGQAQDPATTNPVPVATALASPSATGSSPAAEAPASPTPAESTAAPATPAAPAAPAAPTTPVTGAYRLGPNGECDGNQLEITIASEPTASGAGNFYSNITFTNTSDVACVLNGPPAIFTLADSATGAGLGIRADDSGTPDIVALEPGASGYSMVHFRVAEAFECPMAVADAARVSSPGWDSARTIVLDVPVTTCTDRSTYNVSWVSADSPLL